MFDKLKLALAIAGGLLLAMGAALLQAYNKGRSVERSKGIQDAAEAQEQHNDRVTEAIKSGDNARADAADSDRLRVDDGYKRKRTTKRSPD